MAAKQFCGSWSIYYFASFDYNSRIAGPTEISNAVFESLKQLSWRYIYFQKGVGNLSPQNMFSFNLGCPFPLMFMTKYFYTNYTLSRSHFNWKFNKRYRFYSKLSFFSLTEINWGSSTQAYIYKQALQSAHKLNNIPAHVKTFRPQILVLSGPPECRPALVHFCSHITKSASLLLCGNVIIVSVWVYFGDCRDVLL